MPCALLDVFDVVECFGRDHGFKEKAISATAGRRRKDESAHYAEMPSPSPLQSATARQLPRDQVACSAFLRRFRFWGFKNSLQLQPGDAFDPAE